MNAKEKWIDETMNSLDGISRVQSNPDMIEGFMSKIIQQEPKVRKIRPVMFWPVAASLSILIAMNILVAISYRQPSNTLQEATKAVVTEYLYYLGPIKL